MTDPTDRVSVKDSTWPKMLAELCDILTALFRRRGRNAEQAAVEARETVRELSVYFGGRSLYIPRGERLRIAQRDCEIWSKFNGANVAELARDYNVTEIHLYAILRKQRCLRRSPLPDALPGDET